MHAISKGVLLWISHAGCVIFNWIHKKIAKTIATSSIFIRACMAVDNYIQFQLAYNRKLVKIVDKAGL
jgi:hypothetical protein